jgi:ComF family protein
LCRDLQLRFAAAVAVGNYHRTLSELVVRMKGQRDEALAWQLGQLLGGRVAELWAGSSFDMIVPVPAWWGRRLRRGFVASEIIAQSVGEVLGVAVNRRLLRCGRAAAKQGTLSTAARFRNVAGLFELAPGRTVRDQSVLLVDDVMTSGATASQAADVLKRAGGARRVQVAVVARGARGN